jgi:hypothetical protein
MRRITMLVVVALVMAAMMMVTVPAAFADPEFSSGPCQHTIGQSDEAIEHGASESISGCEPFVEHNQSRRGF